MRLLSSLLLIALLLSGCQSPLVAKRNLRYEGRFDVDGSSYEFKSDYSCHYEDVSWLSERGRAWHNRAGGDRMKVVGRLSDGARYEVLPVRPGVGYGETCEAKSEAVATLLFIELPDNRAESFDRVTDRSAYHKVTFLESKFTFSGTESVPFEPQENWAVNKNTKVQTAKHYYSVWITEFAKENWADAAGLGVREYVKTKKIPWMGLEKKYPFVGWTKDDAAFARDHMGALRWPKSNFSLAPDINDRGTWATSSQFDGTVWQADPVRTEGSTDEMSTSLKAWVNYKGSRIEIPLKDYYRLLYDEQRDRIVKVRVEHIDLW